ncbi:RIP metalloprotease RseP [Lacinutrix sp. Hel_I_90]|uniref:RIP metalloprotease RseP n=1 Tax=Lacinutrix sp. Hel_I_90 TaxID=1249999 RepID=UPI0005C9F3FB|nr:RIP metalloprotease RseP [Lacinutrix sp. Hel_I_90]
MSVFLIKGAQLLLSLSILVILHELGHFIPAKLFKTRVEKFYLFFDVKFSLFKKKIGDTVYGIGWLPLGGYVKISGMIDESMDTEAMAQPPQPWEFRSKPTWQRLIIMLGGVIVNFILAFVLYMMILFVWGKDYRAAEDVVFGYGVTKTMEQYGFQQGDKILSINGISHAEADNVNTYLMFRDTESVTVKHQDGTIETLTFPEDIGTQLFEAGDYPALTERYPFKIDSIVPQSPAEKAGLLVGDKIVSIDDRKVEYMTDFSYGLHNKSAESVTLEVVRNGANEILEVQPNDKNEIGIVYNPITDAFPELRHKDYSIGESITGGMSEGYWKVKDYLAQFQYIFTKKGASQIGGFAAIGQLFPPAWDWQSFWALTAFLSIMLGVLNLLPIPALDGGHVMFLLYEMVTGRKPGDKFMEYAQMIGFFILIALVLFANGNDIFKAIFR